MQVREARRKEHREIRRREGGRREIRERERGGEREGQTEREREREGGMEGGGGRWVEAGRRGRGGGGRGKGGGGGPWISGSIPPRPHPCSFDGIAWKCNTVEAAFQHIMRFLVLPERQY